MRRRGGGARLLLALACLAALAAAQEGSSGLLSPTFVAPLAGRLDCGLPGTSTALPPGLEGCGLADSLEAGSTQYYSFTTDEASSYNILFVLATVHGDASLQVWGGDGPAGNAPPDLTGIYSFTTTAMSTESWLALPARYLSRGGTFTLGVQAIATSPSYTIRVYTSSANASLAGQEAAALAEIHARCCPEGSSMAAIGVNLCKSRMLLTASDPAHTVDQDLCNQPPFVCNAKGQLLRFNVPYSGMQCQGLPVALGRLAALQSLDLTGALLEANTQQLGELVAKLPQLRRLHLRSSNLQGLLNCDIVGPQMQVLNLAGNNLRGTLPECYLTSSRLQELYLSGNSIEGPLPDQLAASSLQSLHLLQQRDRSLTGTIPASIARSQLAYLALGGNGLGGTIPPLPGSLRFANLSDNSFTGGLPELPAGLVSLEVSYNKLSGGIAAGFGNLQALLTGDFSNNNFSGDLPPLPPTSLDLDFSNNSFSGIIPLLPPAISSFAADNNAVEGDVASLRLFPVAYLSLANNRLGGELNSGVLNAPRLEMMDLRGNRVQGTLPSLLNLPLLQALYLGGNRLVGTVPGALFALPDLRELDLSGNLLTGNMYSAAGTLAALKSNVISLLNISGNQLGGDLPQQMAWLALFDPLRGDLLAAGTVKPLPRVFDISDNAFTGGFPGYVTSQYPRVAQLCSDTGCAASVAIAGPDMQLLCPPLDGLAGLRQGSDLQQLARFRLECISPSGERVNASAYLLKLLPPGVYLAGGGRLGAGAIAGIVLGVLLGVAGVAAALWCVFGRALQERRALSFRSMDTELAGGGGADADAAAAGAGADGGAKLADVGKKQAPA